MARTQLNSIGIVMVIIGAACMFAAYFALTAYYVDPYLETQCSANCAALYSGDGETNAQRLGRFTRFGCMCHAGPRAQDEPGYFLVDSEFWDDIAVSALRVIVFGILAFLFIYVVARIVMIVGVKR